MLQDPEETVGTESNYFENTDIVEPIIKVAHGPQGCAQPSECHHRRHRLHDAAPG